MRALLFSLLSLTLLFSCTKEEDNTPKVSPSMTFREDSGYTWTTDTVGMQDTLHVGVTVRKGTDDLTAFLVRVAFDGETAYVTKDSVATNAADFSYESLVVTRAQAGTEKWMYCVREADGDLYVRSILLVVQ